MLASARRMSEEHLAGDEKRHALLLKTGSRHLRELFSTDRMPLKFEVYDRLCVEAVECHIGEALKEAQRAMCCRRSLQGFLQAELRSLHDRRTSSQSHVVSCLQLANSTTRRCSSVRNSGPALIFAGQSYVNRCTVSQVVSQEEPTHAVGALGLSRSF